MTVGRRAPVAVAVTPHRLATRAAGDVLADGGNAIEAVVAAAAMLGVVYPHMTGLGGDACWILHARGHDPLAIAAFGSAAHELPVGEYQAARNIPIRGPRAAATTAGAVAGWDAALRYGADHWEGRLSLTRLLNPAIMVAERGASAPRSLVAAFDAHRAILAQQPGFGALFPTRPVTVASADQAITLRGLARTGLRDFYEGGLARTLARALADAGSPLTYTDLGRTQATYTTPLCLPHRRGRLYNLPPPTQGFASLLILGIAERLGLSERLPESPEAIHLLVEASKLALRLRDASLGWASPDTPSLAALFSDSRLAALAAEVRIDRAQPPNTPGESADTVWLGAMDREGRLAGCLQSLYHEFGSGVVLAPTGILWHNRACAFTLAPDHPNTLRPGAIPRHTLNPALAVLDDGRRLLYGSMGGDGQPQTQAALFTRTIDWQQSVQTAIMAPRWLFGRTWGAVTTRLRLERRFGLAFGAALARRGHVIEWLSDFDEQTGHAGLILDTARGVSAAADPRADGAAVTVY